MSIDLAKAEDVIVSEIGKFEPNSKEPAEFDAAFFPTLCKPKRCLLQGPGQGTAKQTLPLLLVLVLESFR